MEENYEEKIKKLCENETIAKSFKKTREVLDAYEGQNVRVAYSGGSDSDDVMWVLRILGYNVPAVFYRVGIDYQATYDHVNYMRSLGFTIEDAKPKYPIPYTQRKYGTPFISKYASQMIHRLQLHNFKFKEEGNLPYEELIKRYPNSKNALLWWTNNNISRRLNISWNKGLKEFLIERDGLPFPVSDKCCDIDKKQVMEKYAKANNIALLMTGIRKAEGGRRATAYSSCFLPKRNYPYDMYFPLFWWSNADKRYFDEVMGIKHSICYSVYGLDRTGCPGCPYGKNFEHELEAIETYEPKLSNVVHLMFDKSYEMTRDYRQFREEKFGKKEQENKPSEDGNVSELQANSPA